MDDCFQQLWSLNARTADLIYTPLELKKMRVVVLRRGRPADKITCVLETVSLDENCPYEALSYVWGDADNPVMISLNESEYYVTQNLFTALKQLRLQTTDRRLWIDALCINQCNIRERNHQVREMHLIYSGAEQVLAWIGTEADGVDMVLKFASTVENDGFSDSFIESLIKSLGQDTSLDGILGSFGMFIFRDYWRRLWVVQELAHAKQIQVLCGPYAVNYSSIIRLFKRLESETLKRPGLELTYRVVWHFNNWGPTNPEFALSGKFSMYDAIRVINLKQCRDARDRIFGIMSLFPAELRQMIPVDYSVGVAECFASATRAIIETYGSVDIIAWKSLSKSSLGQFPSWAIDWSLDNYVVPCASLFEYKFDRSFVPFYKFSDKILQLRGVQVGFVEHVEIREWNRESHVLRVTSLVKDCRKLLSRIPSSYSVDKSAYTLTCLGGISDMSSIVEEGIFNPTFEISDDLDWQTGNILGELRDRSLFTFRRAQFENTKQYYDETSDALFNDFGLGSIDLKPGDILCLLHGFSSPVILRPAGNYYKFISDSYVYNFADGKALKIVDRDLKEMEFFAIS